jgi:hypothetical protein
MVASAHVVERPIPYFYALITKTEKEQSIDAAYIQTDLEEVAGQQVRKFTNG